MIRYMVVRHPNQKQQLAIHHMLRNYHWESIDDQHVLVLADFDKGHMDALDSHPDVLLAPSVFHAKTLQAHAHEKGKHAHYAALQKLGVTDQHQTVHLAGISAQKYGAKMTLDL
jgi:hypothetical protein